MTKHPPASAKGGGGGGGGGGGRIGGGRGGGSYHEPNNCSEDESACIMGNRSITRALGLSILVGVLVQPILVVVSLFQRWKFDDTFDKLQKETDYTSSRNTTTTMNRPRDGTFKGYTDGQRVTTKLNFCIDGTIQGSGIDSGDGQYTIYNGKWCPGMARWTELYTTRFNKDGEEVERRLVYELEVNVRATFPQLDSTTQCKMHIQNFQIDNGQVVSSSTYPQCLDATFNIKQPWRRYLEKSVPFKLTRQS